MSAKKPKSEPMKRIWSPVRQQAADSLLIMTIVSFAVTVIAVRVFLQLTGYPQVGDSTFHIAHLLWGGLLLFAAVVVMLVWANHWVLWVASIAGGVGVGLFIDEVGKFITQNNDYFFPLAFPIIYAFLLVCVWLYLRVRRTRAEDARSLLYHALEDMKQVLDHDLDPFERRQLVNNLTAATAKTKNPNEQRLAKALLDFVRAEDMRLALQPNAIERTWDWTIFIAARWPSRRVLKWVLIAGFAWSAVSSLFEISALWVLVGGAFQNTSLPAFVIQSGRSEYELNSPVLLLIHASSILVTGLMCAAAALMMLFRREHKGLHIGTLAMVLSLTVVSLLTFYFSQLYAVTDVVSQLTLLLIAGVYRWRFYLNQ